jgi:hypothetical protein
MPHCHYWLFVFVCRTKASLPTTRIIHVIMLVASQEL